MSLFRVFCLILLAGALGCATAQTLERPTVDDLLAGATYWSPELSPSGRYVVGVRRHDDQTFLLSFDLDDEDAEPNYERVGDVSINWVEWVTDERLLVSVSGYLNLRNGKRMTREELKVIDRDEYPMRYTRVLSMKRDGSDPVIMFGDDRKMNRNFSLGRVISFLPNDPDHILMSAYRGGDLDLFRLSVLDGTFERVALGTSGTYAWYVDREGEPAFRYNSNARGTVINIYAREDRKNGKIKWKKIKTIRPKRNENQESATEFNPLAVGPTATTFYVAARPEGEDKTGIYLYDFELDEYVETLRTHGELDISNALFNRETREMQAVVYYEDRLVIEFEDPDLQKHMTALQTYFGEQLNVRPMMSNEDGTRWLIRVDGPADPGSYFVYYVDDTHTQYLGSRSVVLSGKLFGETEVVTYQARDGLELRGYLTRPHGTAPDETPPLIMMPHGGPEVRDIIAFDTRAQILVAQGYQVFQPNFRGSSGFGLAFADLGRRQWGKAMQTDLDDAYTHLVDQGFAAPDRACIMGGSYGGYAALAAATLTPDQYQCAIAIAAPSDLVAMLNWERREEGRKSEAYKYWVEHIGDPKRDKDAIKAVSPALLADRITRPVLLIHGEKDRVVPVKQAEIMEKALLNAGKPHTKIVLEDSFHSYRTDEDEQREQSAILAFLAEHLPVETQPAEAQEASSQ